MKLLYFAWLKEKIGTGEEVLSPPPTVSDVETLLDWLCARGPNYAAALADPNAYRIAVNQVYAQGNAPVGPDDEVALFPPVTGGAAR